jgi:DNA polymerase alpha subunit A
MSKRVGVKSALAQLREGLGGKKRTDQYEVQEASAIIEEVEEGEYEKVRRERAGNDFVVDDDGFGYADDGGEVWDDDELYSDQESGDDADLANLPGGRARKLRAQAMRDRMKNRRGGALPAFREKGQKSLSTFMKAGQAAGAAATSSGVNPVKSANISHNLDDLMKEFEENLEGENESSQVPAPMRLNQQVKRVTPSQSSVRPPEISISKKQRPAIDENQDDEAVNEEPLLDDPDDRMEDCSAEAPAVEEEEPPKNLMSSILGSANWSTAPDEDVKMDETGVSDLAPGVIGDSAVDIKPVDGNGFDFYLIDVHEDQATSSVLLFGRMRCGNNTTQSCCIVVKNIYRNVFFLHTDPLESDDTTATANSMAIFKEFDELRKTGRKPFADIKEFKVPKQLVRRNYAFELKGVPHGLLNFFKITYPGRYPPLPADLAGKSFSRIFGAHTSLTELLLVKAKIQGPSWLRVQGAVRQERRTRSWCKEEFVLDFGGLKTKTFKPITPIVDNAPEAPRLSILGLSVKSIATGSGQQREIAAVAMCFAPSVKLESQEAEIRFDATNGRFAAVRMQEGKALPRREVDQLQANGIQVMEEKPLLSLLCSKIQQLDPDILIGHNVFGNDLDVLSNRLHYFGLKVWHRISRCQRNEEPSPPRVKGGNHQWTGRQFTLGRLVCDTYLNARELLRESTYDLSSLSKKVLNVERQVHPVPSSMIPGGDNADADSVIRLCSGSADGLRALAEHTLCDTLLAVRLAWRLQVLPLTRQLSNLAGNLWANSLLNKRAERNEWLLVHEFKRLKYIVPDKHTGDSKHTKAQAAIMFDEPDLGAADDGEDNGVGTTSKRRKAAAYMGGLVLEPKAGLYDKLVLLLDFNSLYPSIIREYNICFTTVERLDAEDAEKAESAEAVIPAHPPRGMEDGVLPRVIARLVNSRRAVKQMLKTEKNEAAKMMLDIRQKALKLTANSMYGCLGFSSSRFYAKPIASLITWTGRQTLQATVDLVEKSLRLDVVYGDTDSIFVHTGQDDFGAALQIGAEIAKEVNKRYSKLEIEMDGVFRALLLLKKKKYAGLKVRDWDKQLFDREIKGIDMVRRDWCVMSKSLGSSILDQLLSPVAKSKEDSLLWLEEYLRHVGKQMDSHQIPLAEYVITKAITKMPDEYPDAKSQPHVLVAKRRLEAGERIRPGNEIPYIVCQLEEGSLAERARSPEEAARLGLLPDIAWYKAQQIHPPIARLCTPTGLVDSTRIAEWLGLDASRFANTNGSGDKPEDEDMDLVQDAAAENVDVDIRFKDFSASFTTQWKCPKCKIQCALTAAIRSKNCLKCGEQAIETAHIRNLVVLAIRDLQNQALLGWAKCENGDQCGAVTRQVSVVGNGAHCPRTDCVGGRLHPLNLSSKDLHTNLVFLHELSLKYRPEAAEVAQEAIDENAYDTVNLGALFASFKGA